MIGIQSHVTRAAVDLYTPRIGAACQVQQRNCSTPGVHPVQFFAANSPGAAGTEIESATLQLSMLITRMELVPASAT